MDILMPKKDFKPLVITILCVSAALFHLYTGIFGSFVGAIQRSIHLAFMLPITFLVLPASKNDKIRKITDKTDILLIAGILVSMIYLLVNYNTIIKKIGMITNLEVVLGWVLIILVLEAVRRATGNVLPAIALIFILYARFGNIMPDIIATRGYTWSRIASQMYLTTEGIFGMPLGVAANYIVLFVIFGTVLNATGAGDFFMDLSFSATAWARGGPAKSSILASGLFGSISGSAVANVITTGTFTIPIMIKTGYKPEHASAVETVASTGGLIMPPIMGTAAFIMAEMIGVPYISIVKAAIIPALLYYISLFFTLDFLAQKQKLKGIPRSELKSFKETLKSGYEFFIPLILLIVLMSIGWSAARSVTISIGSLILVSMFRPNHRLTIKRFIQALEDSMKGAVTVSATCATAGIIIGVVTLTGLGLSLSAAIIQLSGGMIMLALALTMICSLILGMGMPSSAAYIVLAVLAAPALIKLGVSQLTANFFIFYFGVLSNITPPVALAAYAAASLSKTSAMKVGWTAVRFGIVAFIIPYFFVYGPGLLMQGSFLIIVQNLITSLIGVWALSIAVAGYFRRTINVLERILFVIASLLMIESHFVTDALGITLLMSMVVYMIISTKRKVLKERSI
ncbi:MAG: TRAP transporter permease [Clostridiales bacterium]|nr:TRAP transporter permease [Clostridiales bacterium]